MTSLYDQIQETGAYLRNIIQNFNPQIGIILGTGLGNLANEIEVAHSIPYREIPHFPISTVKGHAGKLIFGWLAGVPIVAMAGRFHHYEGYSMEEVTFPVRVLKFLNIKRLIISNAAGGIHPDYEMGDIVFIRDHISMQFANPLRGQNDERLGVRFPDMLYAYDHALNQRALALAEQLQIRAHIGVYVGTQGPNLETPAEYKFMNMIGGDVVGMSTIPEVLVAKHSELPILVVSVVSNKCFPLDALRETSAQDVIDAVQKTEPKLSLLIKQLLPTL